jgi:hypothetical protein
MPRLAGKRALGPGGTHFEARRELRGPANQPLHFSLTTCVVRPPGVSLSRLSACVVLYSTASCLFSGDLVARQLSPPIVRYLKKPWRFSR